MRAVVCPAPDRLPGDLLAVLGSSPPQLPQEEVVANAVLLPPGSPTRGPSYHGTEEGQTNREQLCVTQTHIFYFIATLNCYFPNYYF